MSNNWQDKTIVVSGGSRGLGAHIAQQAAQQRARLVIVGRSPEHLELQKIKLEQLGAPWVQAVACDAAEIDKCQQYQDIIQSQGVDLLVNAIGRSDRGPLVQVSRDEMGKMLQDNVLATWNITQATLSAVVRRQGVILNIGSLAGLIATPNLGAYCVSKFALTALTRQLRLELQEQGVHVMLVCPGPIARADSNQRYDEVLRERGMGNESYKAPGGGAKLKLLDPILLSDRILASAAKRSSDLVVPFKARILASLMPLFPSLAEFILRKNIR